MWDYGDVNFKMNDEPEPKSSEDGDKDFNIRVLAYNASLGIFMKPIGIGGDAADVYDVILGAQIIYDFLTAKKEFDYSGVEAFLNGDEDDDDDDEGGGGAPVDEEDEDEIPAYIIDEFNSTEEPDQIKVN